MTVSKGKPVRLDVIHNNAQCRRSSSIVPGVTLEGLHAALRASEILELDEEATKWDHEWREIPMLFRWQGFMFLRGAGGCSQTLPTWKPDVNSVRAGDVDDWSCFLNIHVCIDHGFTSSTHWPCHIMSLSWSQRTSKYRADELRIYPQKNRVIRQWLVASRPIWSIRGVLPTGLQGPPKGAGGAVGACWTQRLRTICRLSIQLSLAMRIVYLYLYSKSANLQFWFEITAIYRKTGRGLWTLCCSTARARNRCDKCTIW